MHIVSMAQTKIEAGCYVCLGTPPGVAPEKFNLFDAVIAMLLPFFNDVVGLIGAMGFWPLTVFLPIEMHIHQTDMPRWTCKWIALQALSIVCLIVSLAAGVGAVAQIIVDCKDFVPFQTKYPLS